MSHMHRRLNNINANKKVQPLDKVSPSKNNQLRLKQIYQPIQNFKEKTHKDPKKHNHRYQLPLTSRKNQQDHNEIKYRSFLQNLNISSDIKPNLRYLNPVEKESDSKGVNFYAINQNQRSKSRYHKQYSSSVTKNKESSAGELNQMFKIRSRKSISGSLRKKQKDHDNHHVSSMNPTIPVDFNYFEEGKRLYKQSKFLEALKLFQIGMEKSPENLDNFYYAALTYLNQHNYERGFEKLLFIIEKNGNYSKKSIYLFAAISAKNLQKINKAIALCTQGIQIYSNYTDLYQYRAKLFQINGEFQKAHLDYENVLKFKKDDAETMFNNALCLKRLGLFSNSLSMLNAAFSSDGKVQFKVKVLQQKIKINLESNLKEAKRDLMKLKELDAESSETHLFRGLILKKEGNIKQSILSFEKCIRNSTNKDAMSTAIIEVTKSKIEERDFYSAFYHINRCDFLEINSEEIVKFKLFTEGVIFLMKRKINEGIDNFNKLLNNFDQLGAYFEQMYYIYRAFGYFMQGKHQQAIEDYKISEKYTSKDKPLQYNQFIAEGIICVQKDQFQQARAKFDEAQKVISAGSSFTKIEPFLYRGMTFVEKIKRLIEKNSSHADELQTLEEIFTALKQFDKAYDINESNSNMLYIRALIYLYLGKYDEGLQDIIKAISKSEENVAKYFFFRGLAHETLQNKKQALNDLNICINLDDKYAFAYLERAKLLFSNEQPSKAQEDLNKLKEIMPETDIKYHQCCLNYISKQYLLAEECLSSISNQEQAKQATILVYIKLLRIEEAKELMPSKSDQMICEIMLGNVEIEEEKNNDLQYFSVVEYYAYLGIKHFQLGNLEEAINNFTLASKEKSLSELEEGNNNAVQDTQQQEESEEEEIQIDYETKSNEMHYINFNLFLAYLKNQQRKKAYEIFIRDILPSKEQFLRSQQVGSLSRLLFQSMKNKEENDDQMGKKVKEKSIFQICLFKSHISEASEFINIELPNFILRTKLCYLTPYAKNIYKQYSPKINPDFILECLSIKEVQNRPEPPWVKRNNQDLVFTDEIIDINVEFQTTQNDEDSQEEEQYDEDQEEEEEEEEQNQSNNQAESNTNVAVPFDPKKFRDQMKLDDDIERKLEKIMERKQKRKTEN